MNTKDVSNKSTLLMTSLMAVPACQRWDGETDWFPAVDLIETGQEYIFEVDLPGLKPEEIQSRVDSGGLSITGRRLPRHPGGKCLRLERPSGAFIRRLPLPPDAHGEIHAIFSDGVLTLRVPRVRHDRESGQARAVAREPEKVAP